MQTAAEIIANYKSIQAKPWHHRSPPPAPRIVPVEDRTPQVQPIPITYTTPRVIYFPQSELRRAESATRIRHIVQLVASFYRVSVHDIRSDRRTSELIRARHAAFYLAKVITQRSYPEIGRRMGGRDHTTVLHGVRRVTRLIETDAAYANEIETLRSMLVRP
jgi:chromosomal replication initiator protein